MSRVHRLLLAALAAALLAGCGQDHAGHSSSGGAGTAGAGPNGADVAFAEGMIPHHQQAIDMARLVPSRTSRPELKKLAATIVATQGREIGVLSGWLRAWGRQPVGGHTGGGHGEPGGAGAPGMLGAADLDRLERLRGVQFDLAFVRMMTEHHQGAIAMAEVELREGSLPEVKRLANRIIADQRKEIAQMAAWQRAWASTARR